MPSGLIGILTAGGDCPGLNAGIRAVGKAAQRRNMGVVGFLDGFRGLVENRTVRLDDAALSGILATGGTILGTSRDKPHRIPVARVGEVDMRPMAVEHYYANHLDCLVCLGGDGTMKNAYRLAREGLRIVALPKTIDNDVPCTDTTFGFDTALTIATEAIDRLHTTADSHHRVMVVEIMGHASGWLALGAGLAGGADVILIPEIPYSVDSVAEAILFRERRGKRFSIVAVAEGARPVGAKPPAEAAPASTAEELADAEADGTAADAGTAEDAGTADAGDGGAAAEPDPPDDEAPGGLMVPSWAARLAQELETRTGIEARFTSLGHVQRGGSPTAADRLLATRLGTTSVEYIDQGLINVMVAVKGDRCQPVALKKVAGRRKLLPVDHPWIASARALGTNLGD
jgi:6-phosphofructokinase